MKSIIIPAYNEEKRIGKTLDDYCQVFKNDEIIVVLNGCKDYTKQIVGKYPVKMLEFERAGKGFALSEGFKFAHGDQIGFTDADGSTSAEEFNKLFNNLQDADVIIASRWMTGSMVLPKQPIIRRIASRTFNIIGRVLLGLRFSDTQCGAKVFSREAAKFSVPYFESSEWATDVTVLYKLKKAGYLVVEFPIIWSDVKGTKIESLPKISIIMLLAIIRLRLNHSPFKFIVRWYDIYIPKRFKIYTLLKGGKK